MSQELTEDQRAIREMALGFAADALEPKAVEWDEKKHFPVDVLREAAALGMAGISKSQVSRFCEEIDGRLR